VEPKSPQALPLGPDFSRGREEKAGAWGTGDEDMIADSDRFETEFGNMNV
jgi:hypothetical protein